MNKNTKIEWDILGHVKVKKYFDNIVKSQKFSHAYLLSGPDNVGKRTFALNLMNIILCLKNASKKNIPCGQCENCLQIKNSNHPNIYLVRKGGESKNISIDQIRKLRHDLNLRPYDNNYKFALILNAENLSESASNSFLKTLEEPYPKTIIMLTTTNLDLIPMTIISRCQLIRFNRLPIDEIYKDLLAKNISPKLARTYAHFSQGRPGLAFTLTRDSQLFEFHQDKINELLSLFKVSLPQKFMIAQEITKNQISNSKSELKKIFKIWQDFLRDILLIKLKKDHLITYLFKKNEIKKYAPKYNYKKILKTIYLTRFSLRQLNLNINPRLIFENFIINL